MCGAAAVKQFAAMQDHLWIFAARKLWSRPGPRMKTSPSHRVLEAILTVGALATASAGDIQNFPHSDHQSKQEDIHA